MIEAITIQDIEDLLPDAKRENLTFCKSTKLYGLRKDSKIIAFTGFVFYDNKVVFKNHYVKPSHRGNGYFKALFHFSMIVAKEMKYRTVEATCTDMSIRHYLNSGFRIVKKYKKVIKVRHENI